MDHLADMTHGPGEELLTGSTADRVETDADGSAYEAHVRKADGTEVTVKVDEDFDVIERSTDSEARPHRAPTPTR